MLIPIFKNKGLVAVLDSHRPLRLILILRKVFEMGTTVRLVNEQPYELEQFGFIEKSMVEAAAVIAMSAASMQHVITILLDVVNAYDLVQSDKIMSIVD